MMWRKLLAIVAVGSVVLSVAAGILWVRSYWRADAIEFRSIETADGAMKRRARTAFSSGGRLVVSASETQFIPLAPAGPGQPTFVVHASPQPQGWSRSVVAAPFSYPMPKLQFAALGLGWKWQSGREMDGKAYGMPGVKVRSSDMFLVMPHWMVMLIGLAAPAWWWRMRRRRVLRLQRLTHGLCLRCGYDLRASPAEGGSLLERCPECGEAAAVTRAA